MDNCVLPADAPKDGSMSNIYMGHSAQESLDRKLKSQPLTHQPSAAMASSPPRRVWRKFGLALLLMMWLQVASALDTTRTFASSHQHRRHTLAKRARAFQCGQIKSNSAQYPNVCICFDTAGTSVNFGESTAAVTYANSQGFRFPTSVSTLSSTLEFDVLLIEYLRRCVAIDQQQR